MRRRVYPESEFVAPETLVKLEVGNRASVEAKYHEDVSIFRAEVISRMIGHNAVQGNVSFLFFREGSPTDTDLLVDGENKETLILAGLGKKPNEPPHIKVLTNVTYHHQDYVAFLSEDITVDRDGDSQMLVDVAIFTHEGELFPGLDADETETQAVIFQPKGDDNVTIINHNDHTPLTELVEEVEDASGSVSTYHVTPFGMYTDIEDRIAALDWARGILSATDQAELIGWSH